MRTCVLFLCMLAQAAMAQPGNPGFEEGKPGGIPPGWFVPRQLLDAGYNAQLRREGCHAGSGCAVVTTPAKPGEKPMFGNLMQRFDAAPYRGKFVRFRAWVRLEAVDAGDRAQLWLRVDRKDGMGFFDNMGNRPIYSAEWKEYEIAGEIDAGAEYLNLGIMSIGKGRAWIDDVSFDIVPVVESGVAAAAVREVIGKQYARMDAALESGSMEVLAALAAPGAQVGTAMVKVPFSVQLNELKAQIGKGTKMASRTKVTSVRLLGEEAVVSAEGRMSRTPPDGPAATYATTVRDTWARIDGEWKLKDSTVITTRAVAPPVDPVAAARATVELKKHAVPLSSVQAGTPADDLTAFGKAVGDARFVALGEATHGTREFFQMKHRLLEYLVKKKGFTVFAIEANWPESLAVDRYVKTGEGDPKAALAGMYFWTWNTREVLAMIEWMRAYNKAAGKPVLTFTSFDMQTADVAAEQALAYVRKAMPAEAAAVEAAFAAVKKLKQVRQRYPEGAKAAEERAAKVVAMLDSRRDALIGASSVAEWRDARQAAEIVRQAAALGVAGRGPVYRDEMMARNVEWLAREVHPKEKMVLWAHNGHIALGDRAGMKSMGAWLRERFGKQMYTAGFAFRRGEVRAVGTEKGGIRRLGIHKVPAFPEAAGDAALSAAGMPLLFLDMRALPANSALGRWLAEPRLYLTCGAVWMIDSPESHLHPQAMSKEYDGLFFVEESRAAEGIN